MDRVDRFKLGNMAVGRDAKGGGWLWYRNLAGKKQSGEGGAGRGGDKQEKRHQSKNTAWTRLPPRKQ